MKCSTCGYSMDAFDSECPRCAQGIVQTCTVSCPACNQDNSAKRYACVACDSRLPTELHALEKLPLREYQRRAETLGREGHAGKSIATLAEAAEFYPDDLPTRQALIGILERTGKGQEIAKYQGEIMTIQMKGSETVCISYGDAAHNSGDVARAVNIFRWGIQFHPNSAALHERLAAAYEDNGEEDKARTEMRIASRIAARDQQMVVQRQNRADDRANSAETTGAVVGTAIGATGAVVGGGITIISMILGGLVALFGVGICVFGVLLCITIIGILPGFLLLSLGIAVMMGGFGIMAGGAAAGAIGGMLGILTGALTSGVALAHRSSRKQRNNNRM